MPEPVFIMRGMPTFADGIHASPDMIRDLEAVVALTQEQLESLCQKLNAASGFLDPKQLGGLIRSCVTDDRTAQAVQRVIRNLKPEVLDPLLNSLESSAKDDDDFSLTNDTLSKLRQVLPKLVVNRPALQRYEKAERLAQLTAQPPESIDLICDMRPIFDETRKHIEGAMPYTRLTIVVTGDDGLPHKFDTELTAEQVQELTDKASKALAKLEVLRSAIKSWLPDGLPELPLTRVPRKESSDA